MLDIIIGTAADIAELLVNFRVEKVVRRFSKKRKKTLDSLTVAGFTIRPSSTGISFRRYRQC